MNVSASATVASPRTQSSQGAPPPSALAARRHPGSLRRAAADDATGHPALFGGHLANVCGVVQDQLTRFTTEEDVIAEPSQNTTDSQSPPA